MVVEPGGGGGGRKVICDGLLCCILHRMSSAANEEEFIAAIERDITEKEILESRTKLFTYFNQEMCNEQKKPILQVTRASVNRNIRDIVTKMTKIDLGDTDSLFYMPWDYKLETFETDTTVRAKKIEKEIVAEVDVKIDSLENKMEEKNKILMELSQSKFNEVLERVNVANTVVNSYADVAAPVQHGAADAGLVSGCGAPYGGARPKDGQYQGHTFLRPPTPPSDGIAWYGATLGATGGRSWASDWG